MKRCFIPGWVSAGRRCAEKTIARVAASGYRDGFLGLMSALGHKRTFAVQNAMSALPPKADMKATMDDVDLTVATDNRASRK
jgi:hypothetical protein